MAVNQLVDAQDTLHPVIMVKSTPAVILKFTPSMLLDLDNTLTLGVELPLNSRWSVQQEIGWGNSQFNLWGDDSLYPHKNNWRFRTQLRYFIFKSTTHQGGWYLAAEYFRKEVFIRQVHAFGRDCNPITGTCAYFQEGILRTRRRVSAIHGKLGYQWILPDNRISLDLYMGGGYRRLIVSNDDPMGQANGMWNGFFNFRTLRTGQYPPTVSISAGFSIGILLTQKKRKILPLRL